jgi:hypothetical protein
MRAFLLVDMLEEQGVHVDWEQPEGAQSFDEAIGGVVVNLMASGPSEGIKTGVARFREDFPEYTVNILGGEDL